MNNKRNTKTSKKTTDNINNVSYILIQKTFRGHLVRKRLEPYRYIQYYHKKYLQEKGCKLPTKNSLFGISLEYMYLNLQKDVLIDDIRNYVSSKGGVLQGGTDSLQIRHLGLQYGFNIFKGGDMYKDHKIKKSHYMLLNLTKTYNGFCKEKRKSECNESAWDEIKKEYDYSCVNCGSKEKETLRWNKNKNTVLQQGHMDPRKPLTTDNIIPQCSVCNQQYKNKAIFNKRGFVIDYNKNGF